jgi:hypothetical protein
MKKIEAVTIWKNGKSQEANLLNAYITNDNLESFCSFYYSLNASGEGTEDMPLVVGAILSDGGITMSGEDYLAWDGTNQSAYTYIAEKLNLIIVG